MNNIDRVWPSDTAGKVPYWVYSDPDVYAAELERIWYGPHWLFCALEAEIPDSGRWRSLVRAVGKLAWCEGRHNWRKL